MTFLRAALRDPTITGSVIPSSPTLVQALVAPVIERAGRPTRVLEVGAGTGPVTGALVELLPAGSTLDVVETNADQLDQLEIVVTQAGLGFDRSTGCRPPLAGPAVCQFVCHRGAFTVILSRTRMTACAFDLRVRTGGTTANPIPVD